MPPSKPDCGIVGETVIGNDIQLTCESKEGSPAPQYSWKSYNVLNQERPLDPASGDAMYQQVVVGGTLCPQQQGAGGWLRQLGDTDTGADQPDPW